MDLSAIGAIGAYNVIILRTFIRTSIPDGLFDAAKIDGAGHFTVFFRIVLPLSKAGLATLALFTLVGRWNDWFTGMLYIDNPNLIPLQTLLTKLQNSIEYLKQNSALLNTPDGMMLARQAPTESLRMACTLARKTLIISKKPGNTGISRDMRTEFTTHLLHSD